MNRRVSLSPDTAQHTAIVLIAAIGADGGLFAVEQMQAHGAAE